MAWLILAALSAGVAIGYSIASLRQANRRIDRILAEQTSLPPISAQRERQGGAS